MCSRRSGSWSVTVYDGHFVSGTLSANADGVPNSGLSSTMFFHSSKDAPVVFSSGASVIDPRSEPSVIDPLVTKTRSVGSTSIVSVDPSDS